MPLKPSEAAALADLMFTHLDSRELTDDMRNRLATRSAALELSSFRAYFGSLQKDPVHASAYYLMVDATQHGAPETYLLRFALASAPTTALFRGAMLIGRMRPAGEREVVLNAIPFGISDSANVESFAEEVDRSFLPLSSASRSVARIEIGDAANDLPEAFKAARETLARTGARYPLFALNAGESFEQFRTAAIWCAIRAGWRSGYMLEVPAAG